MWSDRPNEVQQSIRWCHHWPPSQTVALHLCAHAWFDDQDQDDSHHHSYEGGPQVVGDGQDPHTAAGLGLHGGQTWHQTGPQTEDNRQRTTDGKEQTGTTDGGQQDKLMSETVLLVF